VLLLLFAYLCAVYVLPRGICGGFARDWVVLCLLFDLLVYPLSVILWVAPRTHTLFVDFWPVSRAVPVLENIPRCFGFLTCLIPSPMPSAYPQNDHFLLYSAGLYLNTDAAFSTIAYKDSQCLCGFQEKQEKNEKKIRSTTRVNPRKVKIIEKIFAIYFWPLVARVSEGHVSEHPVNTGSLEHV
jgi:hypothetical protein